ncbi:MAG: phosphatase PAP2 family protein [Acidimicrobiales bacterium]
MTEPGPHDLDDLDGEHHVLHHLEPPHEVGPVHRFDDAVDRLFDQLRGHEPSDRILYALSELADFSLGWILLAWVRGLRSDDDAYEAVRVTACLAAESVVVNGVVKSLFRRERPVVQVERPHRLRVPKTTSFPSGHASAAMVAALLLAEDSRAWPLYWGLAVTVAASRIHVQIHHASDVAGGAVTGLVLGTVARKVWPKRARRV